MSSQQPNLKTDSLNQEITWFNSLLQQRLKLYFEDENSENLLQQIPPPDLPSNSAYGELINQFELQPSARLLLILSLIPHLKPHLLDIFFTRNPNFDRGYTEFGGITGNNHSGFLPTAQTAMFLLAGDSLAARLHYDALFQPNHILYCQNILQLDATHPQDPPLAAALRLSPATRHRILTGQPYTPTYSSEFPAQPITTPLHWDNLVLEPDTRQQINDLLTWVQNKDLLMEQWQLKQQLKPGYRALFYGPPGTGKTLTACLLGKQSGLPVYRVDLSKILSKYIGETEKNLARLFDRAQTQDWILFFDEADSLFGKRIATHSSNDRAANQQVSYLLQRIEDYPGLTILATNLRADIDDAFARRFQSMIRFPIPNAAQRLELWQNTFLDKPFPLAEDIDFTQLANDYELTGGDLINILRYACLKAVERDPQMLQASDLHQGIQREFQKQGRSPRKASEGLLGNWANGAKATAPSLHGNGE